MSDGLTKIDQSDAIPGLNTPEQTPEQLMLIDLEAVTVRQAGSLEELKHKIKTAKEMIEDALMVSDEYKEAKGQYEVAKGRLEQIQKRITNLPEVNQFVNTVHDLQMDAKEAQLAVSDYAKEYARMSGSNEITDENGKVFEIVTIVKLVPKKGRKVKK